jgi:hypothetical protein
MAVGIRNADHVAPSIRKSWQSLRRQAAVAAVVRELRPWSLFVFILHIINCLVYFRCTSRLQTVHNLNYTPTNLGVQS